MCAWGTSKAIRVIRRNHPAIADGWHEVYVDECLAEYVQKMNDLGIVTLSCCCGHGRSNPNVLVAIRAKPLMKKHEYEYEKYCGICYSVDNYYALIHYPYGKTQEESEQS